MKPRIIDADGIILGRLASKVAKMLLLGEKIFIINAEKAVISGNKREIIKHYKERQNIRTHYNPIKGPFWFKTPEKFVRRTIRGMLPWKKNRGRQAFKNLRVFNGIPADLELDKSEFETFAEFSINQLKGTFIEINELAKEIGYKH